jgi:hypothetical protein
LEPEGLLELGKKKSPLKITFFFLKEKKKTRLEMWQKEMVLGMCI